MPFANEKASRPRDLPSSAQALEVRRGQATRNAIKLTVGVVGVALAAWLTLSPLTGPPRFPKHRDSQPDGGSPIAAAHFPSLPPLSGPPSMPALPLGVPRRILGLDNADEPIAPSLTDDLKTIVFSAGNKQTRSYDLYIASRGAIQGAFQNIKPITACATGGDEVDPSISSDGLKLAFARFERGAKVAKLFVMTRTGPGADFSTPEPIPDGAGPGSDPVSQDFPVFLARGKGLAFKRVTLGAEVTHRYWLVTPTNTAGPLDPAEPLPLYNPWALAFVTGDGLRAYFATGDGIQISGRPAEGEDVPFGPPGVIQTLLAARTGPIDGPIWVAPKEDVVAYCSPGADKPAGSGRRLWFLRFR